MQQPFPLAIGETMDFKFDFADLAPLGDSIDSHTLTAVGMTLSNDSSDDTSVTLFLSWAAAEVGASGYVICTATTVDGRVIPARMSFFATPYVG